MDSSVTRRGFVRAMGIGAGAMAGVTAMHAQGAESPQVPVTVKIIAVSCSSRPGKTTAQALTLCLEAAKAVDPAQIETQLIELADKVGGIVAVGGVRNGGQELTIQCVQSALLCQEMVVVGDGRPTCHTGATVWNNGHDDIAQDEFGVGTVKNLGRRVAEVAMSRAAATK